MAINGTVNLSLIRDADFSPKWKSQQKVTSEWPTNRELSTQHVSNEGVNGTFCCYRRLTGTIVPWRIRCGQRFSLTEPRQVSPTLNGGLGKVPESTALKLWSAIEAVAVYSSWAKWKSR